MNIQLIKDSINKQSNYINQVHIGNKICLWLNALKCNIFYGATPSDWYFYEMYKYGWRENREIITNRKNRELDKLFNPRSFRDDFDNKVRFNEIYSDFVQREWLYTKVSTKDNIRIFIEKMGGKVVVKPIGLSSGIGVYLFDLIKDNIDDLINDVEGKEYLLEEKIELVEELKRLNPESCQTFRIISMITKTGDVEILSSAIRVGGGNNIIDNFHSNGAHIQ